MSSHHKILGVPISANKRQIKLAYFKKAKMLHPDVNITPNAKAEFIKVKMAYEALMNPKYIHPPIFTRKRKDKTKEQIRREWVRKRREELRKRASTSANRKRRMADEQRWAFQNSFGFNFFNLILAILFILPASLAFFDKHFNPGRTIVMPGTLFIAILLLAIAILLIFFFLYYVYNKLLK